MLGEFIINECKYSLLIIQNIGLPWEFLCIIIVAEMVESTKETESDLHNIPQILKDTTCESTPPDMVQSAKQDHDELQRKGSIHLFLGPAYSEKTARLLAEITYYPSCGSISNKCVLVTNQKAFLDINLIPSSNETSSENLIVN